jgi:hypothetical protein
MKPVPMHPNLPEATSALGTVIKPKQWVECAHCKKLSPLEEREWVGLTSEEIMEITGVTSADSDWNVTIVNKWIRAIEAKLKEKNT